MKLLTNTQANTFNKIKEKIFNDGYAIIGNVFTDIEIENVLQAMLQVDTSSPTFRKGKDLFAIRQFFKGVPAITSLIFNERLRSIISEIFGNDFFIVKSIYFDKPEESNWFVAYHQDLTISVDKKLELNGFGPWTKKQNQFAVQPPLNILEDNFTIRIHLDNTNEENGALKVVPNSHRKGIYRTETINWTIETEDVCRVMRGGIMIMKPLLLHSSSRTTNGNKRRIIHIEFSRSLLPNDLNWAEFLDLKSFANSD